MTGYRETLRSTSRVSTLVILALVALFLAFGIYRLRR